MSEVVTVPTSNGMPILMDRADYAALIEEQGRNPFWQKSGHGCPSVYVNRAKQKDGHQPHPFAYRTAGRKPARSIAQCTPLARLIAQPSEHQTVHRRNRLAHDLTRANLYLVGKA